MIAESVSNLGPLHVMAANARIAQVAPALEIGGVRRYRAVMAYHTRTRKVTQKDAKTIKGLLNVSNCLCNQFSL